MIYTRYGVAVSFLVFSAVLFGQKAQENMITLKNWAAPLYWHASDAEREAAANPVPQLQFSANQVSPARELVQVLSCLVVSK